MLGWLGGRREGRGGWEVLRDFEEEVRGRWGTASHARKASEYRWNWFDGSCSSKRARSWSSALLSINSAASGRRVIRVRTAYFERVQDTRVEWVVLLCQWDHDRAAPEHRIRKRYLSLSSVLLRRGTRASRAHRRIEAPSGCSVGERGLEYLTEV